MPDDVVTDPKKTGTTSGTPQFPEEKPAEAAEVKKSANVSVMVNGKKVFSGPPKKEGTTGSQPQFSDTIAGKSVSISVSENAVKPPSDPAKTPGTTSGQPNFTESLQEEDEEEGTIYISVIIDGDETVLQATN